MPSPREPPDWWAGRMRAPCAGEGRGGRSSRRAQYASAAGGWAGGGSSARGRWQQHHADDRSLIALCMDRSQIDHGAITDRSRIDHGLIMDGSRIDRGSILRAQAMVAAESYDEWLQAATALDEIQARSVSWARSVSLTQKQEGGRARNVVCNRTNIRRRRDAGPLRFTGPLHSILDRR